VQTFRKRRAGLSATAGLSCFVLEKGSNGLGAGSVGFVLEPLVLSGIVEWLDAAALMDCVMYSVSQIQ